MTVAGPEDDGWIVAVSGSRDDLSPLGTGVVIDGQRVLTCAHVVAPGGTPRPELWVSFPRLHEPCEPIRVESVRLAAHCSRVADAAVLDLERPAPPGVRRAPLRVPQPKDLLGMSWWAFGFAVSAGPLGNTADGAVGAALSWGWVRLDTASRYPVESGFSGAPLWSADYQAVVGLIGQANDRGDAQALTLARIERLLPEENISTLASWELLPPDEQHVQPECPSVLYATKVSDSSLSTDVWEQYGTYLAGVADGGTSALAQDSDGVERMARQVQIDEGRPQVRVGDDEVRMAQEREVVQALGEASAVKAVLAMDEVPGIALGRLQVLFFEDVGSWPLRARSLDALLVEAALATNAEKRRRQVFASLSPLARFAVSLMAEVDAPIEALTPWLVSEGHQMADVSEHYETRRVTRRAWILLDLGPEPIDPEGTPWPREIHARLFTGASAPVQISQECEPTADGLLEGLRAVLREARERSGGASLTVDLAAPQQLLVMGLEHLPVIATGGDYESLAESSSVRLRWSQRQRLPALMQRTVEYAAALDWTRGPAVLLPDVDQDGPTIRRWLVRVRRNPWLLYRGEDVSRSGVLRTLLREGVPYIVWRPGGLKDAETRRLRKAVRAVAPAARVHAGPEEIRRSSLAEPPPSVLWDHPQGRSGYPLELPRLQGPGD